MGPKTVSLFKYRNEPVLDTLNKYRNGEIQADKTYTLITNYNPNKIRRSSLHDIFGTETTVIDWNEIVEETNIIENEFGNEPWDGKEATSDEMVSKVLYTDYNVASEDVPNLAYLIYKNGHTEIVLLVDQEAENELNRVVLVTIDGESETGLPNVLVSTIDEADENFDSSTGSTRMLSSSNKIVRVLTGRSESETSYNILPYKYLFSDVDLAILELSTTFDFRLDQKINSFEINKLVNNHCFTRKDNSRYENREILSYLSNKIAQITDTISL